MNDFEALKVLAEAQGYELVKKVEPKDEPKKEVLDFGFKEGDVYYAMREFGIEEYTYEGDAIDNRYISTGNAFHTREDAKAHKAWLIADTRVRAAIRQVNNEWTPDWSNSMENKYYLGYTHGGINMVSHYKWSTTQALHSAYYFRNGTDFQRIVSLVGEEHLLTWFGIKK